MPEGSVVKRCECSNKNTRCSSNVTRRNQALPWLQDTIPLSVYVRVMLVLLAHDNSPLGVTEISRPAIQATSTAHPKMCVCHVTLCSKQKRLRAVSIVKCRNKSCSCAPLGLYKCGHTEMCSYNKVCDEERFVSLSQCQVFFTLG